MAGSSFGTLFRFTSWGESHGPAIGCVVDGAPPRIPLSRGRHPGVDGEAPARPVALRHPAPGAGHGEDPVRRVREGVDHRHADRAASSTMSTSAAATTARSRTSSAPATPTTPISRNTACATIAAAAASRRARRRCASPPARSRARSWATPSAIRGAVVQIGTPDVDRARWDWDADRRQSFWCPDRQAAQGWEGYLDDVRKRGSSCGAVIEVVASGVPPAGRPGLRQARRRPRQGADEHQRREGRRDRRRLRHGGDERRAERRRDAHEGRRAGLPQPTMPAASWAASRPARRSSAGWR